MDIPSRIAALPWPLACLFRLAGPPSRAAAWAVLLAAAAGPPAQATSNADKLRDHLLVVYNAGDPESRQLAAYYASRRGLPAERLLGLSCSRAEEIDRRSYEETIRDPIDRYLTDKGWIQRKPDRFPVLGHDFAVRAAVTNEIWAIVVIRGVPLKIRHHFLFSDLDFPRSELNINGAAVDSELALLPILGVPASGPVLNPYFFASFPRPFEAVDALRQILVTRLDGPTAGIVRRMIDDSLKAERQRLTGIVLLDERGIRSPSDPYYLGDEWLRRAATLFRTEGWTVEVDTQAGLLERNRPWHHVAFYAGWYEQKAHGLLFTPPLRFSTGAVAAHIHSFSAASLRDRESGWAAPLLAAGAACTLGNVYEPYLDLTTHLDVFAERLLQGYTFAEAAYMAQKALSWMSVCIGDPLYQPFRDPLGAACLHARNERLPSADALQAQLARRDFRNGELPQEPAALRSSIATPSAGPVSWETVGDLAAALDGKEAIELTLEAYQRALRLAPVPIDQIRIGQKLAAFLQSQSMPAAADDLLGKLHQHFPSDAEAFGLPPPSSMAADPPRRKRRKIEGRTEGRR